MPSFDLYATTRVYMNPVWEALRLGVLFDGYDASLFSWPKMDRWPGPPPGLLLRAARGTPPFAARLAAGLAA